MVARYCDEEFVVLLPDTDEAGALIIAEALRAAVQILNIPHSQSSVCDYVAINLGVATASPATASFVSPAFVNLRAVNTNSANASRAQT